MAQGLQLYALPKCVALTCWVDTAGAVQGFMIGLSCNCLRAGS